MEVFTGGRTANRQKALSVLAVAERYIRRFQPHSARIGAAQRLRSRPLTASPSRVVPPRSVRGAPESRLARLARSIRQARRPPRRARGTRARGEERSEEPRRASTAPGWGGSRRGTLSGWIKRGRPARALRGATTGSVSTQARGEAASPGQSLTGPLFELRDSTVRRVSISERGAERPVSRAQRSREYPAQRPRACRGLSWRWRPRPTPRR